MLKKILRITVAIVALVILLIASLMLYVKFASAVDPPTSMTKDDIPHNITEIDSGLFVIGNNWFRKSESGLFEVYVEGEPFERGVKMGALTKELAQYQEKTFIEQIRRIVPSDAYLTGLKFFVGWFTRDLPDYIDDEYQQEIYGMSQFASHEYDDLVPDAYQRMLNYHAAHDVGHALQNMSLVGCTSFASWNEDSEDSSLVIARNFDFYVGEDFSRNKIIAFYKPEKGYPFMTVTFGGMSGVLSGMNAEGLTITLNAAKSEVPSSAATPVSIVAREILQYASTIDEAYAIAAKRKTFVAESFLIGSAHDRRAVIIEKSTDTLALYDSGKSSLVCANHFQSTLLGKTKVNEEHMLVSASPYRYHRVEELMDRSGKMNVQKAVSILRNPNGAGDQDIGFGNEKAVNQFIAHHGIVFQPEKKLVWVSTSPWQLGKFVCYDLNKIFALKMTENKEVYETDRTVPADTLLNSPKVKNFLKAIKYRLPFASREGMHPDSVIHWNPNDYYMYMLAGDYHFQHKDYMKAKSVYMTGLTKVIANESERKYLEKQIVKCDKNIE